MLIHFVKTLCSRWRWCPYDKDHDLASAAPFSCLENAATSQDFYRLEQVFVDQFIGSYSKVPEMIVLDMDHFEVETLGQQEFSFYNHHYRSHCLPASVLFDGPWENSSPWCFVPAIGTKEMIKPRSSSGVLKRLRDSRLKTRIILREDGHLSNQELMQLAFDDPYTDFIFGMKGNKRWPNWPHLYFDAVRKIYQRRCSHAKQV